MATPPKKMTISEAEAIAGRQRPWTFRLEFHGTTDKGQPSHKFWYATGRGTGEAIEIGWGAIGAAPSYALIDWAELKTRTAEKLDKGYGYAPTAFIRMSAGNLAVVTGQASVAAPTPPPAPPAPVAPVSPVAPVATPSVTPAQKTPAASLLALGEPFSLIRKLKMKREGSKIIGFSALDETGAEVCEMDAPNGRDFAKEHDLEVEFG